MSALPDRGLIFLTIVVAGGGFAGTETVAAVNDFLRESLQFYPHLEGDMIRVVLVRPGDVILPELGPSLGAYAQRKLTERKVEIRVSARVVRVFAEPGRFRYGGVFEVVPSLECNCVFQILVLPIGFEDFAPAAPRKRW